MRRIMLATAVTLIAVGALPTTAAQSLTFTVDCSRGQTITQALRQGDFRQPLVINVRGTCREFVNITRANVTLRGTPEAEIFAPDNAHDLVTISADKVTLENLTLTGGLTGLTQNHEPSFVARKVVVRDASDTGVRVRVGDARLIDCTVQRSSGVGVSVVRGGSVVLSGGSQVLDSAGPGISASGNSIVALNDSVVMGSGKEGVLLSEGSRGNINSSTITANGAVGLHVGKNASANVFKTTISRNGTGGGAQGDGVMLYGGAQGVVEGESVITDNRDDGIDVAGAASLYSFDTRIAGNGGDGIMGYLGANLVLGGLEIEGNGAAGVSCHANCTAQMEDMEIHGNSAAGINLAFDSTLMLFGTEIDVTDNVPWGLYCNDAESSVNDLSAVAGTVSPTCTAFD